jgi:hypothetical protein
MRSLSTATVEVGEIARLLGESVVLDREAADVFLVVLDVQPEFLIFLA